jgi:4-hydroxybenzoyl-CoA thioesterase
VESGAASTGEYIAVRVDIRWTDLDPAGIVFYPRFFSWMDRSSHVLARELGVSADDMVAPSLLGFPIVEAQAQFLAPGEFEDSLEVRTRVSRIGRTSFGVRHEVWRLGEHEKLLARGVEERVFIGRDSSGALVPREITPAMCQVLEHYLAPLTRPD